MVFASGGGTNFQALIDRFSDGQEGVELVGLVASRDTAGAIQRAERAGIPWVAAGTGTGARETNAAEAGAHGPDAGEPEADFLLRTLARLETDLVVLAGYLRLVPAPVVTAWWGRIINIHPALLPAFGGPGMYGQRVHAAVLARGVRVTGVTVHFVDEEYDRGPIIAQWPVPVLPDDDPARLAARVLEVEHELLPRVVAALARGEVHLDRDGIVRGPGWPAQGERFALEGDR